MKYRIIILLTGIGAFVNAQLPVAKIDINMEGRRESEVNTEGYTPWYIPRVHSHSITVSGVTFELVATSPADSATMRTSWSKALVQSPYYMTLVNDGVKVDNDSLLAHPGEGGELELHITGLPEGMHALQTYHNIWEDTTTRDHWPINVYLNDQLIHENIKRSVRVLETSEATILLTELNVTRADQEMVLRIEPVRDFVAPEGKTTDLNVHINAIELNTSQVSRLAREPVPADGDLHVDADEGSFTLQWKPAKNGYTRSHHLYFGIDSLTVAGATPANAGVYRGELPVDSAGFYVKGLYNLDTYFWRVDETDSAGITTKGNVWKFKPRHLAFRGAEGYGRFATGGRGGKVVYVTNLNDAGPGTLREAITHDIGPRTILFAVSGIIKLESRLVLNDRFVTIAGQTAPGKGICIRSAPLGVGTETITRFIRVRLGAGPTFDGIGMRGNNHSIVDHCSISWTIDEAFSSRDALNITLQCTLISEALNIADHENYPEGKAHGYAASIGGDIGSFHHNLLAHCNGRNWSLAGGLDGAGYYAGRLDIFNNVVYNWGGRTTDGGAHEVNFVNNYYKKGVASTENMILTAQLEGTGKGTQSYYYSGNILQNTNSTFACDGTDNNCARDYQLSGGQILDWDVFVDSVFFPSYARIQTAREAYKSVLSDVGCSMPLFDEHDQRIIRETLTGTYTYTGSKSLVGGIIDHQDDAGGYENYPEETRPPDFDSDMDGLPDWWENLFGSNPDSDQGDFTDSNADPDRDGYTALEDYLEWLSVPHYYLKKGEGKTIELSVFTAGYNDPAYSCDIAGGFDLAFSGSSVTITPTGAGNGISYLDITATDREGSVFTRRIGICLGAETPLGEAEIEKEVSCRVYPTLFDSHLNIELFSEEPGSISVLLYDLTGKLLLQSIKDVRAGQNLLRLDCPSNLPAQMYVLLVTDYPTGEKVARVKVMRK
ncbi:MAG: T9SS C-terminal target domain-containing protein [Bacteroidales bacterium]|nr:T9SS C-terminal target domain-containing protein [Bacteroidales bacterium]